MVVTVQGSRLAVIVVIEVGGVLLNVLKRSLERVLKRMVVLGIHIVRMAVTRLSSNGVWVDLCVGTGMKTVVEIRYKGRDSRGKR